MNMTTAPFAWKSVVAALASAAVLGACSTPPAKPEPALKDGAAAPASLIEPYIKIGDTLRNDSIEGVSADANQLASAAKTLGPQAAKVDAAAVALASTTGISDAREKFADVSDAVVGLVDEMHLKLPDGVRVAVCPMKRKPWMQKDAEIHTNPYYGAAMPGCGAFR